MSDAHNARPRQTARPPHSEAYWRMMKYVIFALAALMVGAIAVALYVIVRFAA